MTVFSNACPSQEVHVSLLAFFFFLTCLGDSQLSSDFVWGGGTLFCLILGLETSVSCSICGTWEAILTESLSDTITDGSVETAREGASSGLAGSLVLMVFREKAISCCGLAFEVSSWNSSPASLSSSSVSYQAGGGGEMEAF